MTGEAIGHRGPLHPSPHVVIMVRPRMKGQNLEGGGGGKGEEGSQASYPAPQLGVFTPAGTFKAPGKMQSVSRSIRSQAHWRTESPRDMDSYNKATRTFFVPGYSFPSQTPMLTPCFLAFVWIGHRLDQKWKNSFINAAWLKKKSFKRWTLE